MRLAGVVMVLMDAKILSSGNLAARILTTSMRSVLQKIALLLVPPAPTVGNRHQHGNPHAVERHSNRRIGAAPARSHGQYGR